MSFQYKSNFCYTSKPVYVRNVVGKQPGEILENFSNCLLKCCTVYIHWKFALIRDTEKDGATQGTLGWSTCRP